jgi:TatD-related deoxyribonuclease
MNLPIFDSHFHLDPRGKRKDAVKEFKKSGGTHLLLAHKPYSIPRNIEEHEKEYEITLKLAEEARETGVEVFVALGPHPCVFTELIKNGVSIEEAEKIMREGIEIAAKYIKEGEACALGEVGRPHYEVSKEVWDRSNAILSYSFENAKELGCAVVVHTESASEKTFEELAKMADYAKLSREKVVKHYSPPIVGKENFGIFPSILAGKESIACALQVSDRFLMETDYMDDPDRPGAVLGPATVPKRTKYFFGLGKITQESWLRIHKENPKKVFGIEIKE